MRNANIQRLVREFGVDPLDLKTYTPAVSWWFGMIATLHPPHMVMYLQQADDAFEAEALANQIVILSKNVLNKHRWVNRGWVASGVALLLLVMAIGSSIAPRH